MHLSHQNFCYKFQVKSDKKCDAALKDKCEDICTKLDGYVEKVFLTVLVSRIYSVGNLRKGGNKLHVPIGPHSKVRCSQCDQIGRVLKVVGYKFTHKSSPKRLVTFEAILKISLYPKTAVASI